MQTVSNKWATTPSLFHLRILQIDDPTLSANIFNWLPTCKQITANVSYWLSPSIQQKAANVTTSTHSSSCWFDILKEYSNWTEISFELINPARILHKRLVKARVKTSIFWLTPHLPVCWVWWGSIYLRFTTRWRKR